MGQQAASIPFSIAANATETDRTATLTIAGKTASVHQKGQPPTPSCTYAIDPEMASYPRAGGSGTIAVTTQEHCQWTGSSQVSWITITSPADDTGAGGVSYVVSANDATAERTGTLEIAGHTVTIVQEGNRVAACTYSVTPVTFTHASTQPRFPRW